MTAEEHIVTWIESSAPEYARLLRLFEHGNSASASYRASEAFNIAVFAYRQMIKTGDASVSNHDARTILGAALALANWKLER